MEEIWKDVVGYEGLYKVSNMGNIMKLDVDMLVKGKYKGIRKGKITKGNMYGSYYVYVLRKKGNNNIQYIHRLIAKTFVQNKDNKPCINHKNGIKTDNRVENLERCTKSENNLHAHRVLGRKSGYWLKNKSGGENTHAKKIIQYDISGNIIKKWNCIIDASKEYGICSTSICGCCKGRQKTAGGFIFKYE